MQIMLKLQMSLAWIHTVWKLPKMSHFCERNEQPSNFRDFQTLSEPHDFSKERIIIVINALWEEVIYQNQGATLDALWHQKLIKVLGEAVIHSFFFPLPLIILCQDNKGICSEKCVCVLQIYTIVWLVHMIISSWYPHCHWCV